jgi:hypothetical protein
MHLANVVLFAHIAVAIVAFVVAGLLLTGLAQLRAARNMSALRAWAGIVHRAEPLFPILVVVLIALGAWLIALSHGEFAWSQGWIITSLVGLVLMEAFGGAVLAPAGKRMHALIESAPDGPVSDELRSAITNPAAWIGTYANTGIATGIVFLMATKPNAVVSVVVVVVAAALACAIGVLTLGRGTVAKPATLATAESAGEPA